MGGGAKGRDDYGNDYVEGMQVPDVLSELNEFHLSIQ